MTSLSNTDPLPGLEEAREILATEPHWTEGASPRVRALQVMVAHQAALIETLQHDLLRLRDAQEAHLRGHFAGLLP